MRIIFKAQAVKSVSEVICPEQFDLWLPDINEGSRYSGAPLLIPMGGKRDGRPV